MFPEPTLADWQAAVGSELGWNSPDGPRLKALYTSADALPPDPLPTAPGWRVRQDLDCPTPIPPDLEVVGLRLDRGTRSGQGLGGGDGLALRCQHELEETLQGYRGPLVIVCGAALGPVGLALQALEMTGTLEIDLAQALIDGHGLDTLIEPAVALVRAGYSLVLSQESLHEAGATTVQELGYASALLIEWLRHWPEDLRGKLSWSFSLGSRLFFEVAKLRAARHLWTQILRAFGSALPSDSHARSGRRDLGRYDACNNLLRIGMAGIAAGLAGCQTLHLDPYTQPAGANPTSLRLARNQQQLLRHEGQLEKILDATRGAYLGEQLSHELGRRAWLLMQEVGDVRAALREGGPQQAVAWAAAERAERLQSGQEVLVGLSRYALPGDVPLELAAPVPLQAGPSRRPGLDLQRVKEGAPFLELVPQPGEALPPLTPVRFAEPFEVRA